MVAFQFTSSERIACLEVESKTERFSIEIPLSKQAHLGDFYSEMKDIMAFDDL